MWLLNGLLFFVLCGTVVLGFKPLDFKNGRLNSLKGFEIKESKELIRERLPRVAEIQSYNLTIQPYFPFKGFEYKSEKNFTFDGQVTIHFTITNDSVTKFPFYAKNLEISKTLLWENNKQLNIKSVTVDKDTTLGFVEINKKFEMNKKYRLFFEYTGIIGHTTLGLFYNMYRDGHGEIRYLIATQFEALAARRVFPSADDPHFKSKITLTIIHPALSKAYSNSEVESEDTNFSPTHKSTTFKPSPFMSDYLLAFAVGDFYEVSTKSKSGIPIRVISHNKNDKKQELKLAAKCLDTMEKLIGIPYNHSKLDHIWLQQIAGAEAMENWGLITYNGMALNLPPKNPTEFELYDTYSTICHETSHQWFGNLVTGDNWGQIFLHEGFANYFENHALIEDPKTIDPEYVKTQIIKSRQTGLDEICDGSHAIVLETQSFDGIIYNAGGAVLRMIKHIIGTDKFYEALKIYLTKHAYKTATYKDLISAFEEALQNQPLCGDLKIGEFIRDFLLQAAYPNIYVKIENQEFVFTQSASGGKDLKWNIPLFVRKEGSTEEKVQLIWVLKNNTICSTDSQDKLDPKKNYDFNVNLYSFAEVNQKLNKLL